MSREHCLGASTVPFLPFLTRREPMAAARLIIGPMAATLLDGESDRFQSALSMSFAGLASLAPLTNDGQLAV